MKIEKQLTDSRCRYFYTLSTNDEITLKSSIECNKSNVSEKSSSIKGIKNE